jgi:6-phosphogluconolactonase (cycloisomerase 2 family)
MATHPFLCGTYTRPEGHVPHGKGLGISLGSIDAATAQFTVQTPLTFQKAILNPSYVAVLPGRSDSNTRLVAAVQEAGSAEGDEIVLFELESLTGKVLRECWIPTNGGVANCHITLFPVGDRVFCASAGYCSGTVHVVDTNVRLKPDQLGSFVWPDDESAKTFRSCTVAFPKELTPKDAPGRDVGRQEGPHAHQIIPLDRLALDGTAAQMTLLSFDLGGDYIGSVSVTSEFFAAGVRPFDDLHQLPIGTGPRHGIVHGTQPLLFVLGELSANVAVLRYSRPVDHPGQVSFTPLHSIQYGSVPGKHLGAAIRLHRSGDHLVVSSRFDNQIVVLGLKKGLGSESNEASSEPSLVVVETVSTRGLTPRDIAFDPTGHWLVVGNQDSDDMQLYRWGGAAEGLLQWVSACSVGTPVCVAFL